MKHSTPNQNKGEAITQARRRINIIKGQLEGLMKMIEKEEYCIDILTQSSAIQSSMKSLDSLVLEHHLNTHVSDQFLHEKDRAIKELLKVFKQANKNK
jgi:CsoR family transcriptional regulator, copper-sensing transcriptional repressor